MSNSISIFLLPAFIYLLSLPLSQYWGRAKSYLLTFILLPTLWFFLESVAGHALYMSRMLSFVLVLVVLIFIFLKKVRLKVPYWLLTVYATYLLLLLFYYICPTSISSGEKVMDFGILRHFYTADYHLPVEQIWMSGTTLKYYYFGHYLVAIWMRLLNISADQGYFGALALYGALTVISLMTLLKRLGHSDSFSLFGAPALFISGLFAAFLMKSPWELTRLFKDGHFIEYPLWSFLWGDLHAHVMTYFLTFFIIALLLKIDKGARYFEIVLVAFLMVVLLITNSWGFLTLVPLTAFTLLWQKVKRWKMILIFIFSSLLISIFYIKAIVPLFMVKSGDGVTLSKDIKFTLMGALNCYGLLIIILALTRSFKTIHKFTWYFVSALILSFLLIYHDSYNTIFKFQTAALSLTLVFLLSNFVQTSKNRVLRGVVLLLLISSGVMTIYLFYKFNSWRSNQTLSQLEQIEREDRDSYELIKKISENPIFQNRVLLEFGSAAYNYEAARISSYSGMISYLGWDLHLYDRGEDWQEIKRREGIVAQIYQSNDSLQIAKMLKEEKIEYVVLGTAEDHHFGAKLNRTLWNQHPELFQMVVETEGSKLYLVR